MQTDRTAGSPDPLKLVAPGAFAALRAEVRDKLNQRLPEYLRNAASWLRIQELLDHADAQEAELSKARARVLEATTPPSPLVVRVRAHLDALKARAARPTMPGPPKP